MMGCIYEYTHRENGKKYIGMTIDPIERNKNHQNASDPNSVFHAAIRKYGFDAFNYHVIEWCDESYLGEREMYWISHYNTFKGDGYNSTPGGSWLGSGENHPRYGTKHSEETKEKIRKTLQGRPGKPHTEEAKKKMRGRKNPRGMLGKKHSEETKKKMSESQKTVIKKKSPSRSKNPSKTRKPSRGMLGKKHSEETKIKIGNSRRGKKHSEETIKKLRERDHPKGMLGKKHSEETKNKIRDSLNEYYKNKKRIL